MEKVFIFTNGEDIKLIKAESQEMAETKLKLKLGKEDISDWYLQAAQG